MLRTRAVNQGDLQRVLALARRTGVFTTRELAVLEEVLRTELGQSGCSDYHSSLVEESGHVVGFVCYGPTPMTDGTYDLYWIFVHPSHQHHGIGGALLREVEEAIRKGKGRMLLADTSSSLAYLPARKFYQSHGFRQAGEVRDYYRPGDSRLTYVKRYL